MSTVSLRVTTCKDKGASVRGASLRTRVNPARSPNRPSWTPPSFSGRKLVALRAGDDEAGFKKAKDDDEDVGGDNAVQDALASELKFQTKLYQAQQYIEGRRTSSSRRERRARRSWTRRPRCSATGPTSSSV